ncbi:MAG: FAD-binding oxidoreductase [Alphaproteobacteria bacterium]
MADALDGVKLQPFWWDQAPRDPVARPALPREADVAVIGSGYTGLSAALTALRGGRSVVVIEAEQAGHGASSRNGGGVGNFPFKLSYGQTERLLGADGAKRLWGEGKASVDYVEHLLQREQIQAHFVRSGRYIGAHRASAMQGLRDQVATLQAKLDAPVEVVEPGEQEAHIGSTFYHGGRFNRDDGVIHPALFHQGLLARVRAAGGVIVDGTRATQVRREGAGFVVETDRGALKAGQVAIGANGYTDGALPKLARRVIPVASQIIATEELPEEQVRRLVPRGNMIIDTKRTVHYYRASHDGRRILMGGRPLMRNSEAEEAAPHLRGFMVKVWPELADVRITHAWGGKLGFTFDKLPHIGEVDGVHYACGYLGSGVAMSTYLGHKLGLRMLGDPEGATALDGRSFPTMPFYGGNPWFLSMVAAYYRVRDSIG